MGRRRQYTLNENYFKEVDNSNKAYILGFIYADGSISLNKGSLVICISEKDKEILNFIKEELNYSGNITTKIVRGGNYSLLNIVSKQLVLDLIKLGVVPNKTYSSNTLPIIPNDFYWDMLRGFFDGDGSIFSDKQKQFTVCFSSNIYILKQIKEKLKISGISSSKIRLRNKKSIHSAMLEVRGSKNIEKFKNILYTNNFCLTRKYDKFLEFQVYINNIERRNLDSDTINNIKNLYEQGLSQKTIHEKLNLPYSSVRGVIQRLRKINKII